MTAIVKGWLETLDGDELGTVVVVTSSFFSSIGDEAWVVALSGKGEDG